MGRTRAKHSRQRYVIPGRDKEVCNRGWGEREPGGQGGERGGGGGGKRVFDPRIHGHMYARSDDKLKLKHAVKHVAHTCKCKSLSIGMNAEV